MAKALDVQDRLEYARSAVAVLRALKLRNLTLSYSEFGKAIGLIADNDTWQPWHRQQVADILNIVSAAEKKGGVSKTAVALEYKRVVNKRTAKAGKGIAKESKIIRK